ncbi:GAF domain-containing protein [uncultured Sphingomonas sp.]|uniref:GAF domain-containing protein n=1 Tax=uncultured Sphingomonas sp. TaxID=158754 RepID=UPI0035CBC504
MRLAALDSYGILDTRPEPEFDAFVARAARRFRAPISLISLVDHRRQWFKARIGLTATETDKRIAFCTHTVRNAAPLVVRNATRDARFADNPLVTGATHIRFYAGAPLITPLRRCIGTINVLDTLARPSWDEEDTADLEAMAHDVMIVLERRRAGIVRQRALSWRS